jgi:hypothetical protein
MGNLRIQPGVTDRPPPRTALRAMYHRAIWNRRHLHFIGLSLEAMRGGLVAPKTNKSVARRRMRRLVLHLNSLGRVLPVSGCWPVATR